jgi:hypothetical protein
LHGRRLRPSFETHRLRDAPNTKVKIYQARSRASGAPSPRSRRGEGWGEGLSPRARLGESPPHPDCFAIRPLPASGARWHQTRGTFIHGGSAPAGGQLRMRPRGGCRYDSNFGNAELVHSLGPPPPLTLTQGGLPPVRTGEGLQTFTYSAVIPRRAYWRA